MLTADGGFTPRTLPRQTFAPIDFNGHADLKSVDGSVPPALQQVVLDFDRDGRLSTGGLPVCQPSLLEEATPAEARSRCPNAIVGTGHVSALITREDGPPILASSLLTLFNGPPPGRQPDGHPPRSHDGAGDPDLRASRSRSKSAAACYRYRATVDVPPIAAGRGSLVHLDVKVGKRYRYRGSERSYTTARCGDGIFRTHGRFTFADGTVIDGSVEKACTVRKSPHFLYLPTQGPLAQLVRAGAS